MAQGIIRRTANSGFQALIPQTVCVPPTAEQGWSSLREECGLGGAAFPLGVLLSDDRRNLLTFPVKTNV